MKKLFISLVAVVSLATLFTACNKNNEPTPPVPADLTLSEKDLLLAQQLVSGNLELTELLLKPNGYQILERWTNGAPYYAILDQNGTPIETVSTYQFDEHGILTEVTITHRQKTIDFLKSYLLEACRIHGTTIQVEDETLTVNADSAAICAAFKNVAPPYFEFALKWQTPTKEDLTWRPGLFITASIHPDDSTSGLVSIKYRRTSSPLPQRAKYYSDIAKGCWLKSIDECKNFMQENNWKFDHQLGMSYYFVHQLDTCQLVSIDGTQTSVKMSIQAMEVDCYHLAACFLKNFDRDYKYNDGIVSFSNLIFDDSEQTVIKDYDRAWKELTMWKDRSYCDYTAYWDNYKIILSGRLKSGMLFFTLNLD